MKAILISDQQNKCFLWYQCRDEDSGDSIDSSNEHARQEINIDDQFTVILLKIICEKWKNQCESLLLYERWVCLS